MKEVEDAIRESLLDGRLPCKRAFDLASERNLSPLDVHRAADEADTRISRCQLGLFGFEDLGGKRLVYRLPKVPESLEGRIREALIDGRLPCATAWRIAKEEALPRFLIGCACETLEIRIAPCQLGCF